MKSANLYSLWSFASTTVQPLRLERASASSGPENLRMLLLSPPTASIQLATGSRQAPPPDFAFADPLSRNSRPGQTKSIVYNGGEPCSRKGIGDHNRTYATIHTFHQTVIG